MPRSKGRPGGGQFFFDNNLARPFVAMLRAVEVDVVHIQEVDALGAGATDEQWIEWAAKENRIAVTADHRIRKKASEKKAFQTFGGRVVFVPDGFHNLGFFKQAVWLMRCWEAIEAATAKARSGDCFVVGMQGGVEPLR